MRQREIEAEQKRERKKEMAEYERLNFQLEQKASEERKRRERERNPDAHPYTPPPAFTVPDAIPGVPVISVCRHLSLPIKTPVEAWTIGVADSNNKQLGLHIICEKCFETHKEAYEGWECKHVLAMSETKVEESIADRLRSPSDPPQAVASIVSDVSEGESEPNNEPDYPYKQQERQKQLDQNYEFIFGHQQFVTKDPNKK